jgi:hypothetical protein
VAPVPVVRVRWLAAIREYLDEGSKGLEALANLLRQLVHVVGWVVLLDGSVNLLIDPHLSLTHLVVPGAGSLAVLQGLIKRRERQEDMNDSTGWEPTSLQKTDLPSDVGRRRASTQTGGEKRAAGTSRARLASAKQSLTGSKQPRVPP